MGGSQPAPRRPTGGRTKAAAASGADPVLREAWGLFFELFRALEGDVVSVHAEFGLTPVQGHVLRLLGPQPDPMSELAQRMGCDASNITGITDRLEKRGLLERRSVKADRRVKLLALTAEGERVRTALLERISEPPLLLHKLSVQERRQLRDLLKHALSSSSP